MATLNLDQKPEELRVGLVAGADFIRTLESEDGDWPGTAVIKLIFNDTDATTWTATIAGADATWNIDKAVVDALIADAPTRAKVTYVDGPVDLLWAVGGVTLRGSW